MSKMLFSHESNTKEVQENFRMKNKYTVNEAVLDQGAFMEIKHLDALPAFAFPFYRNKITQWSQHGRNFQEIFNSPKTGFVFLFC